MAHEDINREQEIEGSSDRSFGVVFAVVFLLIAGWPLWYGEGLRWWAAGIAAAFALIAMLRRGELVEVIVVNDASIDDTSVVAAASAGIDVPSGW